MLIAGGLAGLAAPTVIQGGGPPPPLTFEHLRHLRLRRHHRRPARPGQAGGRACWPACSSARSQAGGTVMQAATNPQVPVDIVEVIQGLIVLFVAAPPLIRAIFRLRAAAGPAWRRLRRGGTGDGPDHRSRCGHR